MGFDLVLMCLCSPAIWKEHIWSSGSGVERAENPTWKSLVRPKQPKSRWFCFEKGSLFLLFLTARIAPEQLNPKMACKRPQIVLWVPLPWIGEICLEMFAWRWWMTLRCCILRPSQIDMAKNSLLITFTAVRLFYRMTTYWTPKNET